MVISSNMGFGWVAVKERALGTKTAEKALPFKGVLVHSDARGADAHSRFKPVKKKGNHATLVGVAALANSACSDCANCRFVVFNGGGMTTVRLEQTKPIGAGEQVGACYPVHGGGRCCVCGEPLTVYRGGQGAQICDKAVQFGPNC